MYPSRSAFRQSIGTDTEGPEAEELSEREQDPLSEAEDEPELQIQKLLLLKTQKEKGQKW